MSHTEQQQVIDSLRKTNEKSNHMYRAALVTIYALVFVLYLTPIPAYLMGRHPKSQVSLFLHGSHKVGSVEDLTYLPAFPIYLVVATILTGLMSLAAYELADRLGWVTAAGHAFPAQPHSFGTAPSLIVPVLRDIRLQSSKNVGADATQPTQSATTVVPPRIIYVGFLWVCSWPIPLITFGLGAFDDVLWWSFPMGALSIHLLIEWWMYKAELETLGLNGLKYNYKGA